MEAHDLAYETEFMDAFVSLTHVIACSLQLICCIRVSFCIRYHCTHMYVHMMYKKIRFNFGQLIWDMMYFTGQENQCIRASMAGEGAWILVQTQLPCAGAGPSCVLEEPCVGIHHIWIASGMHCWILSLLPGIILFLTPFFTLQITAEDHPCSMMVLEIKEAKSMLPPPNAYSSANSILVVERFMRTLSQGVSLSHLAKTTMVKLTAERKRKNTEKEGGGGGVDSDASN